MDFLRPPLDDHLCLWKYGEDLGPNCFWLYGISFEEFLASVEHPLQFLLLRHNSDFGWGDWHSKTHFVVVTEESELGGLANAVKNWGDFWWVDISRCDALDELAEEEFLDLIYLKQTGRLRKNSTFPSLKNRFVYMGHDDFQLVIHVNDPRDLAELLARVISWKYFVFSGRKVHPQPNLDIASDMVSRANEGFLLDFKWVDAHHDRIPIFTGEHANWGRFLERRPKPVDAASILVVRGDRWEIQDEVTTIIP